MTNRKKKVKYICQRRCRWWWRWEYGTHSTLTYMRSGEVHLATAEGKIICKNVLRSVFIPILFAAFYFARLCWRRRCWRRQTFRGWRTMWQTETTAKVCKNRKGWEKGSGEGKKIYTMNEWKSVRISHVYSRRFFFGEFSNSAFCSWKKPPILTE